MRRTPPTKPTFQDTFEDSHSEDETSEEQEINMEGPQGSQDKVPAGKGPTLVNAISFKQRIPEFWKDRSRLWFKMFEIAVASSKASDQVKAEMVIAKMNQEQIFIIADIIENPVEGKFYEQIKEKLIKMYEMKDSEKVVKLQQTELGDLKPSQLLDRMKFLGGSQLSPGMLRSMWEGKLPVDIQIPLSARDDVDLDKAAEIADNIAVKNAARQQISAINTSDEGNVIAAVMAKLEDLNMKINQNKQWKKGGNNTTTGYQDRRAIKGIESKQTNRDNYNRRRYYNNNQHNTERFRNQKYFPRNYEKGTCYFHERFGDKAYKCEPGCKYFNKSQGNGPKHY